MEIRLNRIEFLNELVPMQGIVERRTAIPVLSHLLLKVAGERLRIAATDLDVSLESWAEGDVAEEGAITVQAKKLFEIIRASAGDDITLRIDQDGVLSILSGKSRFKIHGLPAEDFPTLTKIEDDPVVRLPFREFKGMIAKVLFAISSEDARFQLSGALLELRDNALVLVATDGHRLALVERAFPGALSGRGAVVPRKALQELQRFESDEELVFRRSDHHLSFTIGRRQLICRILEGAFPDYERVISKVQDKHIVLDRKNLAAVIHRVSLLTGDRTRAIRMELQAGQIMFSAANPDLGEAIEEIPCDYAGAELALGLNPDYLGQFLGATETENVRLELKDGDSQCVAYPEGGDDRRYLYVIMPIRL